MNSEGLESTVLVVMVALVDRTLQDRLLSYRVDSPLEIGAAVIVPYGKKEGLGFVTKCGLMNESELGIPFEALRPIESVIDGLSLPMKSIELVEILRMRTACTYSQALNPIIPSGLREQVSPSWALTEQNPLPAKKRNAFELEPEDTRTLTPSQKEILRTIKDAGGITIKDKAKQLESSSLRALLLLQKQGYIKRKLLYTPVQERKSGRQMLQLTDDHALIQQFLSRQSKKKPAQALVIMRLQESAGQALFTSSEIKAMAGVTEVTIRALVAEHILLHSESVSKKQLASPPNPNSAQKLAIDSIQEAIHSHTPTGFLLFGITGSGKTEVYLRAASEAIKEGRQVVYLVPEIALAAQAITRLRERYGDAFAVIHSELTASERLISFQQIRDGKTPLALGARSALFAPFDNLGLIIVDEEHETSYKQDAAPRYHAVDIALELGKVHSCPVVLGSATPSIESFYKAEIGELTLLSLPIRAAGAELPEVEIDDLTLAFRSRTPAILGEPLRRRLEEMLKDGNQGILFLNRRAYAPFLQCRNCGGKSDCPRCSVTLSFHAYERTLRCHHCGHSEAPPDVCPKCSSPRISPIGMGTEKVEEAIRALYPDVKIGRLDRDIARKKGQLEQTLAEFSSGEIQILVGTQMIAKGLDFPNVTLVGVIMADISLNLPDFRAGEKTFQLLSQVSGRAGRSQKKGHVVIQTFNPNHPAVVAACNHDYIAYYESIKRERFSAEYPPFRTLVNVTISADSRPTAILTADAIESEIRRRGNDLGATFEILGPVDCALEKLRDRWRRHLLIKLPLGASVRWISNAILPLRTPNVQITFDPNPYSMM